MNLGTLAVDTKRQSSEYVTGACSHVVKSRGNVSHQTHQEERDLKNRMLNEMEPVNNVVIPRHSLKIRKEANKPDQYSDSDALKVSSH